MNGQHRKDITPGLRVFMTQKHDQRTGKLTSGVVKDILHDSRLPLARDQGPAPNR